MNEVHVAVISTKYSTITFASGTARGLTNQVYDWVAENWDMDLGPIHKLKTQEAIDTYFRTFIGDHIEFWDTVKIL